MKDCCAIVVAHGIEQEVVDRFVYHFSQSQKRIQVDLKLQHTDDSLIEDGWFCKTRALNRLLREAIDDYRVIVQTDIDNLFPVGLLDTAFTAVLNHKNIGFHCCLRHISADEISGKLYDQYPFDEWKKRKFIFCSGAFNTMSADTWRTTKGYNESIKGWGVDDSDLFWRSKRLGVKWIIDSNTPLVHIAHPPRGRRNVEANTSAMNKYSDASNWLTGVVVERQTS